MALYEIAVELNLDEKLTNEMAERLVKEIFKDPRMMGDKEFDQGDFNRILMAVGVTPAPLEYVIAGVKQFYGKYWAPPWKDDPIEFVAFTEVSLQWENED